MDYWAEFFIAADAESAVQVKGSGTRGAFESPPGGIYDPADAVVEWEGLLAGISSQSLVRAGEPRVLTEITNDGCYVFVLSERMVLRHLQKVSCERGIGWSKANEPRTTAIAGK